MGIVRLAVVVAAAWVIGCQRSDRATIAKTEGEVRMPATVDASPLGVVRTLADIAEQHGRRVIVEGRYEVDPIAAGKGRNLVWIVLVDGTHISRAYVAVDAELPFIGRHVRATGVITSGPPSPYYQSLLAPHLTVESIVLAPGEPPLEAITSIPAPPIATTTAALGAHIDRWVQIVGTLSTVTAAGDASLQLSDGGRVHVERIAAATWTPHVGKLVTVTGRIAMEKGSAGALVDLVIRGKTAICAGSVTRCGM